MSKYQEGDHVKIEGADEQSAEKEWVWLLVDHCEFAACEKRTLGNFGVPLLEWAVEQLQTAGSLTNLLKFRLAKRKPPP